MIRCFNCGYENEDGQKYCNGCGAMINVPGSEEPMEAIPVATMVEEPAVQAPVETIQTPVQAPVQPQPQVQRTQTRAPAKEKNDGVCLAGFITSLVSILCCGMTSFIGLGLSIWGFLRVKKSGQKGSGLAIAGIIISGIFVFVFVISWFTGTFNRLTGKTTTPTTTIETTEDEEEETTTETTKATTKETTEATTESSEETTEETTETTVAGLTGIRPEFQQAMDDYEAFYDEYISFMRNYYSDPGNAINMMADYTRLMSSINDVNASFEALDDQEMSAEEAQLYLEVSTRVEAKMLAFEAEVLGG